jgi:hypothetical protein
MSIERLITVESSFPHEETVQRLETAVKEHAMTPFAHVDHSAGGMQGNKVVLLRRLKYRQDLQPLLHCHCLVGVAPIFCRGASIGRSGLAEGPCHEGGCRCPFSISLWFHSYREVAGRQVGGGTQRYCTASWQGHVSVQPANSAVCQRLSEPTAAASLGMEATVGPVNDMSELESLFTTQVPNSGFVVIPDVFTISHCAEIISLAARWHVPAIYWSRSFTEIGGLISYGPYIPDELPACGAVCPSHPQRRETKRAAGSGVHQVRA